MHALEDRIGVMQDAGCSAPSLRKLASKIDGLRNEGSHGWAGSVDCSPPQKIPKLFPGSWDSPPARIGWAPEKDDSLHLHWTHRSARAQYHPTSWGGSTANQSTGWPATGGSMATWGHDESSGDKLFPGSSDSPFFPGSEDSPSTFWIRFPTGLYTETWEMLAQALARAMGQFKER